MEEHFCVFVGGIEGLRLISDHIHEGGPGARVGRDEIRGYEQIGDPLVFRHEIARRIDIAVVFPGKTFSPRDFSK